MQKRVILVAIALVCSGLVAVLLSKYQFPKEPYYDGRPLNYWVAALLKRNGQQSTEQAPDAIRQMDTNAIPYLLKWIQREPASWRSQLAKRVAPLPPHAVCVLLANIIANPRGDELAAGATLALQILGPRVAPATDDLVSMMNNTAANVTSSRATFVLGYVGTNSLPALLKVAQNPQHPRNSNARLALARIISVRGTPDEFANP